MYGELQCLIKMFTRLETFSNIQNSYQKILQKFSFSRVSIAREESSINRRLFLIDQIGIEHQSSKAEASFLINLIDQAKASTD